MSLEQLYQQIILDHAKNPNGTGLQDSFDAEVYHVNPTCGDECTLRLLIDGSGAETKIAHLTHDTQGCSISVAAASVMTDLVEGCSVHEALERYDNMVNMLQTRDGSEPDEEALGDAVAFSGVAKFPARVKCALLGWAAMKDALLKAAAAEASSNHATKEAS